MSIAQKRSLRDRQNFEGSLTASEVAMLVKDPDLRFLQTSSPVDTHTWTLLNEKLFAVRNDIQLRVYGFYSSVCDLSFLSYMRNVQHFSADCLQTVKGIEHIGELHNLKSLAIGIYDLETFDFLKTLQTEQIYKLSLCLTKSKRPNLDILENFRNLKILYIEGQQKSIDTISTLERLEDLTLRSVSPEGLGFVRTLKNLRSLDIKLGGIQDLSALEGLNQIQYLELWQVKGLADISVISTLTGLQFLFLQALRNIRALPNLEKLMALRRIILDNMKGLKSLEAIVSAPALEEFLHISAIGMNPDDYEDILEMKSLKRIAVGFGSFKKNAAFNILAAKHGVELYNKHREFEFTNV